MAGAPPTGAAAGRRRSAPRRLVEAAIASRPGAWFFVNVAPRIDRPLLRLTRGRLSISLGQPVGALTTVGRKTGAVRRTPLLYTADGERIVLIASKGGAPGHPAWFLNLRANPDVEFTARGRTLPYRAHEAEGAERERLWSRALRVYSGYDEYQRRAGSRRIPVVVLEPKTD